MKDNPQVNSFSDLMKARGPLLWINLITLYRMVAFPVLLFLIFTHRFDIFRWLLILSFLTDAVDGFLARGYKVNSLFGAKMDSIGDDLTVLAGVLGLMIGRREFLLENWLPIAIPLALFFVQLTMAIVRYGKISSFHTYLAKVSAVLQGFFLCSMFLFPQPSYWLFYSAVLFTTVELIEEIIIVIIMPEWRTNIHGLYWVLKSRKEEEGSH